MKLSTRNEIAQKRDLSNKARDAGLFVVEKQNRFLLYRQMAPRNVLVGESASLDGLKRLVRSAAGKH